MPHKLLRALALASALSLGGCFVFWSSKKEQKDEIQEILDKNPDLKTDTHSSDAKASKDNVTKDGGDNRPALIGGLKSGSGVFTPQDVEPAQRHLMSGSKSGLISPYPVVTPTPSTSNTIPVKGSTPIPSPTPAPSKP